LKGEAQILVVDDEAEVCTFFRSLLEGKRYRVIVATSGREARRAISLHTFHAAMVDLKLPDVDGLSLLEEIKRLQPGCEVIIMTGYGSIRTAVRAIQMGAYDYIEKPFEDISQIEVLIDKAVSLVFEARERNTKLSAVEWGDIASRVGIVAGSSPVMSRLLSVAFRIARKNVNVLIQGETGTGKELLARFIHAASHRSGRPFIAVNCSALPENLLESELFGHEKGAFTGATSQRRGIFELANQGTLFLDEIGEASPCIQVKLLRVLETGEFMRVGGEKPIKTDVRLVAATNADLEQAVREKRFREDLFYRLDVIRLNVPPLRERKEDIPALVDHFLHCFVGQESPQCSKIEISPEAMEIMLNYPWPGNVRELSNVIRQAATLSDGMLIEPRHLPSRLRGTSKSIPDMEMGGIGLGFQERVVSACLQLLRGKDTLADLEEEELHHVLQLLRSLEKRILEVMSQKGFSCPPPSRMREIEREVIKQAMTYSRGNITLAARALGIGRNTLHRKLKELHGEILQRDRRRNRLQEGFCSDGSD